MLRTFKALTRGLVTAACLVAGLAAVVPGGAIASGLKVCVQNKEGGSIKLPKGGVCKTGYTLTELGEPSVLSKTEQEELKELRKYAKVVPSGIDGKPTVQVTGANVQIVNGERKTATTNGEGNLVIGYDENERGKCSIKVKLHGKQGCEESGGMWILEPHAQTGSHNLIFGSEQEFTSYGGIVDGSFNSITAPFASVTGGLENTASSEGASVSGGNEGTASGESSSVSGGWGGVASEVRSSVSGGESNTAAGYNSWAGGGIGNHADGNWSSVFGGKVITAPNEYEAIP